MSSDRKQVMMIWLSYASGILIAIFWSIWWLIADSVPMVSKINCSLHQPLIMPFGISRWWDILMGPVYSIIFILLLTSKNLERKNIAKTKCREEAVAASIIPGLITGAIFAVFLLKLSPHPRAIVYHLCQLGKRVGIEQ